MTAPKRPSPWSVAVPSLLFFFVGCLVALAPTSSPGQRVFFGLFGVLAPLLMVANALRKARSSESSALVASVGFAGTPPIAPFVGYRTAGRTSRSARELYGAALDVAPLPAIATRPGSALAYALTPKDGAAGFVLLLLLSAVMLGASAFLFSLVRTHPVLGVIMGGVLGVFGLLLLWFSIAKLLGRAKLPLLEVSEEPILLGETLRIRLLQAGPATIQRLRIDVVCRERATYHIGTDSRSEEQAVSAFPLLDHAGGRVRRGETRTHDVELVLPTDAPASFASKNNSVAWLVRVRADIKSWPDYDETYEVRVLPAPSS